MNAVTHSLSRSSHDRRLVPLFRRVLITNTVVLFAVPLAAGLAASTAGPFVWQPVVVTAVPLLLLWAANFYALRGALAPLGTLSSFADRVDLLDPGPPLELDTRTAEVVVLTDAINRMLARLQEEQRSSARRAVVAQEAERKRIAQELHDEVGQTLTAVLLELDQAAKAAPPELRERLTGTLEAARASLEDVRRIAVELRPEVLDELGLPGALIGLCERFGKAADLHIERDLQRDLPQLSEEQEIAFYRVAQEALTNVVRHSGSRDAHLRLYDGEGAVTLEVSDSGTGRSGTGAGTGIIGMRERAGLIGASLTIAEGPGGGCLVRLTLTVDGNGASA
jgi:two-component system sensor histidine kinase UhpB